MLDRTAYSPVANELLHSSGMSAERRAVRRRRALELAAELTDINAARALIGTLVKAGVDRPVMTALSHLERRNAELRPTVAWVQKAS